jgi:hypothetical protein
MATDAIQTTAGAVSVRQSAGEMDRSDGIRRDTT